MEKTEHTTLVQLQQRIRAALDGAFPFAVWVSAEISELKVNYSGHCYLELIEHGGTGAVPRARASAVIWRSTYGALSSYFRMTTGTDLCAGMKVLVRVSVIYHDVYGLSLQIADIDPLYTLGERQRQRQETVRRLQEEGVYDMNRSLEMPALVRRIAVVSSRNAAGYRDFMKELARCPYDFRVELFDAFMQGGATEESVVAALGAVAARAEEFDAVVMIRGGGSQSDLACFDAYRLCAHVAQFPLPVLTGIGHDKDESVADLVAAVSLKTPTAVAGWLVERMVQLENRLSEAQSFVAGAALQALETERERLRRNGLDLSRTASRLTHSLDMRLERLSGELNRSGREYVMRRQARLEGMQALLRERSGAILAAQAQRLASAGELVAGRRPERILSLGFAIVRRGGKAVHDAAALQPGQQVELTFARGQAAARIVDATAQEPDKERNGADFAPDSGMAGMPSVGPHVKA